MTGPLSDMPLDLITTVSKYNTDATAVIEMVLMIQHSQKINHKLVKQVVACFTHTVKLIR